MPQPTKPFGSWRRKFRFEKELLEARQPADKRVPPGPPHLSLADVETRLNMHQYSGLFDNEGVPNDSQNDTLKMQSGSNDCLASAIPPSSNVEWNAVGPAGTAKTGRVIHNLQEEIARLTRECTLQRLRAEEEQQTNDTLKLQLSNVTDRLNNAEQLHEADLLSINRKDRKIDELKMEIEKERMKRIKSEEDAKRTNQIAAEAKDLHTRTMTEAQEIAAQSKVQYEAIAKAHTRTLAETQMRMNRFKKEVADIGLRETERQKQLVRLDAIIAQKNEEIEAERQRLQQYLSLFEEYKLESEKTLKSLTDQGKLNDEKIDRILGEATETVHKLKWANNVRETMRQQD
ncbi:hypothetical protein KEM54_005145 [Ascosphaera aggregata]|nr:hypothetical protein KEM54_005145 [Ascosphaera aggregata]